MGWFAKRLAFLALIALAGGAHAGFSNCPSTADMTRESYYAQIANSYTNVEDAYCFGAYADTSAKACQAAMDGWISVLPNSFPPGTVNAVYEDVNQYHTLGSCDYGTLMWLHPPLPPCPVSPLTPLSDPAAIDFENGNRWRPDLLTADFQQKLQCMAGAIAQAGGSYAGTSAYRPTEYQAHLKEVISKDALLTPPFMSSNPQCQSIRDAVSVEMGVNRHNLKSGQAVAKPGLSRHESGQAFDITPSNNLTSAQMATIASQCGVTRNAVPNEPWHFQ